MVVKPICISVALLVAALAADKPRITDAEGRKLIDVVIPSNEKKRAGLITDLDREQGGCAVYHVYRDTPPPEGENILDSARLS
jgi:hypothetical protein